jgi:hypothetical protein
MKRFDLVFEKAMCVLNEREYVESTFGDNARSLLSMLQDHDLLDKGKSVEAYLKELQNQTEQIKQVTIGANDASIPTIQLKLQQNKDDSNSFSVTVVDLEKPEEAQTYENDWLETIFKSVVDKVKTLSLKNIAPEAAVDQLPQEETPAASQPGAEKSALPGV